MTIEGVGDDGPCGAGRCGSPGKSTFPGTPVNIAERVPGSGTAWTQIGTTEAAADGSFAVRDEAAARRPVPRAGRRRPDHLRRRCGSRCSRSLTIRALATRAKVGGAVTVIARVTPAHAATVLDLQRLDARHDRWLTDVRKRTAQDGRGDVQVEGREGRRRGCAIAVRPLGLRVGWAEAASAAVTVTGVK